MPETTVTKDLVGLPLGLLISQPIIEVAKGQAELCHVYLDTLLQLAFTANTDKTMETRVITFQLNRPVVQEDGSVKMVSCQVQAPLLALVPLPAFTMEEATVRFSMELKSQEVEKDTSSASAETSGGFSAWGFTAKISGKVSTDREHTRSTDKSAKYEIYAHAVQHEPPEGMARLNAIFASVIEPISNGQPKSGGGDKPRGETT